ncbi:MAG: sigma-70 family RNA polymerase sigma factor [Symploca sp. SIO2G7]|nr:sigma-70 family RNA polymerase sigma factor [Symploca sp. SIO2G7]
MINSTLNRVMYTDNLNEQLNQLIKEARMYLPRSLKRQKLLNEIVGKMQQSKQIWRGWGVVEELYEEALQQTWLWFSKNFCNYDLERGKVMTWFNKYLKFRIQDLCVEAAEEKNKHNTTQLYNDDEVSDPLENIADPAGNSDPLGILKETRKWLEQQKSELRCIHVRDRTDINAYNLILYRLPTADKTWEELAKQFGVSTSTLSSFYQRKCFPLLLDFGKSQGWIEE